MGPVERMHAAERHGDLRDELDRLLERVEAEIPDTEQDERTAA